MKGKLEMGFNIWEWVWSILIGVLVGLYIPTLKDQFGKWWFVALFLICLVLNLVKNAICYLIF